MPVVDDYIANAGTITSGTAVGRVVSVDSTNRFVYYLPAVDTVGNFNSFQVQILYTQEAHLVHLEVKEQLVL